jgi:hypothetical protein
MNYKFKITDKFRGRKYKFSSEDFDVINKAAIQDEETLLKLAKNISHSDVTVVFITRSILESKWIPIEVQYSLDHSNFFSKLVLSKGVLGVVIPDKGNDYSYIMKKGRKGIWQVDKEKIPMIISSNMHNEKQIQNKNNIHYDSFISVYRWEDFVKEFDVCIESAYDKATNYFEDYNITKK